MADVTAERLTPTTGTSPNKGTYGIAANTLIFKGQIVCADSAGRAAVPAAGLAAVGISKATYNNRTGAPSGGAADAVKAEVDYGVHGLAFTGTAPKPGQVVYVVDNQTVSLDPAGNRGVAGIVAETKNATGDDGLCYVFMGPVAIALAASLQSAQSFDIPVGSMRLASGAAIPAFSAGVADGLTLDASEGFGLRINDDSVTHFVGSVRLPESLPAGSTLRLHALVARIGAADAATATVTPLVFANREGAAYTASSNLVTGNFPLFSAATTVVQEVSLPIDQNGGAQAGDNLTIDLVAAAGLDDDDAIIFALWISAR